MESYRSYEQKMLISELIHGLNLAKQLRCQLNEACTAESREVLMQGILTSYEKALLMLKWSGPTSGQPQTMSSAVVPAVPESPLSVNGSPQSEDFEKQLDNRETSKKRKMLPKWTDQVKTCSETGLEGPNEDGYSWRKYGQKDILAAKYPRSYYRCTYRNTQNCLATKQVQRSDNDHTVFEITYRGKHTCSLGVGPSTPALMSPEKEDPNRPQPHDVLTQLRSELTVETDNLGSTATELPCPFPFPPYFGLLPSENPNENFSSSPFISPSTPESNYFLTYPGNEFGLLSHAYRADSGLTDIISGNTSCTNSPILDLDFSLDTVGIDPNFPFDAPGFF